MSIEPGNNNSKITTKKPFIDKIRSMNRNTLGIIICAIIIFLVLIIFFISRGGNSKNEEKETNHVEAYAQIGDSDISDVTTDSDEDDPWKSMKDDQYQIDIQVVEGGYSGPFVEDGSDETEKNLWALIFTNNGNQAVQYAEYVYSVDNEAVSFKLSDLPAGQSCMVIESGRKAYKESEVLKLVSRVVAQVDEIPHANDKILVVDNNDNTVTIMNLTDEEIPVARIFYKTYNSEENIFIGGITYTAKSEKIPAGGGVTIEPAHYESGASVVVGSGIYDE